MSVKRTGRKPIGLEWRASSWTVTFVIGLGISVDLLVYSIIIPVMPFHLESLGFSGVSALTGWLLFAYSAGLVISTIPIAMFSERYNARQWPLVSGLIILVGSQIMLMEAPNYAVMCIARLLQGIGSSMVWVVGLALLCDSAPPSLVGSQLGIAMCGLSIGTAIGPPVGGALYSHFGYRGPFIFGIAATVLDLAGRLVIIERKEALLWGFDPAAITSIDAQSILDGPNINALPSARLEVESDEKTRPNVPSDIVDEPQASKKNLSLLAVLAKLFKSPRALTALLMVLAYGVIYSSQEPSIPLHLQQVWGLNSKSVGLVFIAAVIPTLFSSPLGGYLTDRHGPEWPSAAFMLLSLPWWGVVAIRYKLALFISAFAMETFFTSGVLAPVTAELASVSRALEGVGYAHVYGAFNLVFGIGSSVGPVIGGQMYTHIKEGWLAICLLSTGVLALSTILSCFFIGEDPLFGRLRRRIRRLRHA